MLKKLIKYDFKDQGKSLWPLHLALLGGSVLAGISLQYFMRSMKAMTEEAVGMNAMQTITMIVMILFFSCLMASSIVTLVFIGRQYFNNCFRDEGYLTFTLPVTPSQVLLSKLITGTVWTIINLVAVLLCCAIFLWIGFSGFAEIQESFAKFYAEMAAEFAKAGFSVNLPLLVVKYLLLTIISSASGVAMLHFVITMGSQIAKKHKILCAVGLYLLLTFALSCVSSLMSSFMTIRMMNMTEFVFDEFIRVYNIALLMGTGLSVVVGGLLFYFTDRTLSNRLNLE